jgi:hypothetical protein
MGSCEHSNEHLGFIIDRELLDQLSDFFFFLYGAAAHIGPWPPLYEVPPQGRYLHRTTQTQNKRIQTSMPLAGFEPTIPVFKRAKTFHALDRAATVIGTERLLASQNGLYSMELKRALVNTVMNI